MIPDDRRWRRQHLRILAARGRRIEQSRHKIRLEIHPAHERYLRDRAFGGHVCRPYRVTIQLPLGPSLPEHVCPECRVERADHEGPGRHLDRCPNCGSSADPVELS